MYFTSSVVNRLRYLPKALAVTVLLGIWVAGTVSAEAHFIGGLETHGSGCPPESVEISLSSDHKLFSVIFREYVAEAGPAVSTAATRKSCIITADVEVPRGQQGKVRQIAYRGFVSRDVDAKATVFSQFKLRRGLRGLFGASPMLVYGKYGLAESDTDYLKTDGLLYDQWSGCRGGRHRLILKSNLTSEVFTDDAEAIVTIDSVDGELVARPCGQY